MNNKHSEFAEDAEEPSITSSDPNERKLARRLRVQQRLEALTKKRDTEDEEIAERTLTENQILASSELLASLLAEGDEVVSCVRLANDARELQRRKEEQEIRKALLKTLEEDDQECMRKYKEINERWSSILASKDPLDIHAEMESQNARCMEIMARKDAVIAELQQELENADLKFLNDQKTQNEDIDLLVDRMDSQINAMTKACHRELSLIDNAIESERKMLLENIKEKWEALYKKLQEDNLSGLDRRKDIMREYEEEMKKVMIEHQEEFRAQKISLELEIQKLQQEVQNTKALCFMNIEKLDYSYAVLKRREDENAIVKNQQKRRINKLQDIVNALKKEYAQLEESTRLEIQKLTDQVVKAHRNILDLMEKSSRFAVINDKKYLQIWDMNAKIANQLLGKILNADEIMYEQALRLEWNPPEKGLLKKEDLPSYLSTVHAIEEENRMADERRIICKSYKPASTIEGINLERRLLNHIIKHIADQCDYLIENKLLELLLPYTTNDQLIVRLDNVFQALKINSEQELGFLLNFFLPYAYCSTCTEDVSGPISDKSLSPSETSIEQSDICGVSEEFTADEAKLIAAVKEAIRDEKSSTPSNDVSISLDRSPQSSLTETLLPIAECTSTSFASISDIAKDDDRMQRHLLCDKGHLLEIEATFVTRALREFVERYHFVRLEEMPQTFQEKLTNRKKIISRNMAIEDVTSYWMQYSEIFSAKRERLWDGLLIGLKKYHGILKERDHLNIEMESLRKQNAELRRLLKTYIVQPECSGSSRSDEKSVCEVIK
ncbi:dynein regulatory complex protein 1 [Ooceraea biroi]|uniref:dynein regulatory complex protein 1 n=1 Tax=Ooceraea biroi TaxID=2015173 RepID=UPI000F087E22|nr:dynein regulatory complex protein 1 [Ooceraea biroi]XP_026828352.1 dynein regulatory complex protein 1 [Ooceraea biroi]XP_026828353.1 dynein regulatory complex protein 1 [Ooceraea biroi]XP_026828354.1 dynein regulatory complex protein 1 [Ooceraea biroi]